MKEVDDPSDLASLRRREKELIKKIHQYGIPDSAEGGKFFSCGIRTPENFDGESGLP